MVGRTGALPVFPNAAALAEARIAIAILANAEAYAAMGVAHREQRSVWPTPSNAI